MTTVILTALGSALGMVGLVIALRPGAPSLRAALHELDVHPRLRGSAVGGAAGSGSGRIDRYVVGQFAHAVSDQEFLRARLWPMFIITGTSIQDLCGEILLGSVVGVVLPGLWWMVVTAGGVHLPFFVPVWAGLALGFAGACLPLVVLHARAAAARDAARRVVGSFLNLVVLCLAGGMGIESALHASARIGEDDVSERILNALRLAQDAGEPPWDALDHLGRDLGVTELTELAAAVGLAGTEGARIRTTLSAKASSIRRHDLADAEAKANAVTERLFLPGVFLLVGFLIFIAYPAVTRISAGL